MDGAKTERNYRKTAIKLKKIKISIDKYFINWYI